MGAISHSHVGPIVLCCSVGRLLVIEAIIWAGPILCLLELELYVGWHNDKAAPIQLQLDVKDTWHWLRRHQGSLCFTDPREAVCSADAL